MKTKLCSWIRCLVIVPAVALFLAGCSKKEEPAPSAETQKSSDTTASLQKAASDMKDKVQQTAQDAAQKARAEADKLKTEAQQQVQQVKEQVVSEADKLKAQAQAQVQVTKDQIAAGSETVKAQSLIDKASKLVADTKYADAANVLKQLASLKLTPEQQKTVDDLTGKIKTALAGDAARSVGNLLDGKK
jgi:F0F1-type ATP synthase membrane subunit b/b'